MKKWKRAEMDVIQKIAERAGGMARGAYGYGYRDALMDITACHYGGQPLDLKALLAADDFNFAHDVFGINRHLDRESYELTDCFVPRFAAHDKAGVYAKRA